MRICVVSTPIFPCPPPGYSGLEMLAYQQAEGLARRGHHVLLVAPKESKPPPGVVLHGTTLGEDEGKAYSGYWQRLPNYDAIITNSWSKWEYILKAEGRLKAPVLGVLHAPVHTMYRTPPPVEKPCLVAISKDQAIAVAEFLNREARVCYNGIDPQFYQNRSGRKRNNRYLFLARMSTIKGPHIAVELAQKLRFGLDLVGDDMLTTEPEYRDKLKAASVNGIAYIGPQTREQCVGWFSANKALLHMNLRFREPFGLAPIEAMACGMPVIAFRNGAMAETVKHGETGFLVWNKEEVDELIKADAVSTIQPERCREWALQFTVEKMIDRWEELIAQAIEKPW
jgi:glycosyltransferase involved in cell wall biosynthesis